MNKQFKNADGYCNRLDYTGFRDFINSATDLEKAKYACNETLKDINMKK